MRRVIASALLTLAAGAAFAADAYKLLKTVPVEGDGGWDYLLADEAGRRVYVSHGAEVVVLDADKMKVLDRFPLDPGEGPSAMAIDRKTGRVFIGCHNKLMVVVDAATGKVVAKAPIGERVDAAAFDPETATVYFSCGDGTVTAIHEDKPDEYTVADTIKTRAGSRTLAVDLKTHNLFLPGAEFKPGDGGGRPKMTPGTFSVQVYGK